MRLGLLESVTQLNSHALSSIAGVLVSSLSSLVDRFKKLDVFNVD